MGGSEAGQHEFPWHCALLNSEGKFYGCSATLLSCDPVIAVTAAHCVTQLPRGFVLTTIRLGEHDLDKEVDCETCPPPQDIAVEEIIFHPSYGSPEAPTIVELTVIINLNYPMAPSVIYLEIDSF